MNPWDILRRVAADTRSGAAEIAERTAVAVADLTSEREVIRAARTLLRRHAAMAPLWRVFAAALDSPLALATIAAQIEGEADAVGRAATGWALPKRASVLTHSWSSTVHAAIGRGGKARIGSVVVTTSLPGGEGRAFVARLRREGVQARVIADAAAARECATADVVLVGADAVTGESVINKVGTMHLALAAREHGVPCYALAGTSKLMPHEAWRPERAPAYEATPLSLFDAVIFEKGPMRPPAVRRAAARIAIPDRLLKVV